MSNYSENVKTLLDHLKVTLAEDQARVKALRADGVPFWRQLHAWGQLAANVVAQIAVAAKDVAVISADDKLEAAVSFLDGLVNIPFVPAFLERKVIRFGVQTIWGVVKQMIEDEPSMVKGSK